MSQRIDLEVKARETGRKNNRALRNQNQIPAVVYGATKNALVSIDERAVMKYNTIAYENALFNLKGSVAGLANTVALIKEVVINPVNRRPEHVDLFALDLTKTVRVSVEVKLTGKPVGLSEGGLLNVVTRQVEVECLPTDIPDGITADISHLGVSDSLHVSDLKVPSTLKVLSSADLTIAVVNLFVEDAPKAETAVAADAAATPAAGAAAPAADAKAPAKDAKAAPAKDAKK